MWSHFSHNVQKHFFLQLRNVFLNYMSALNTQAQDCGTKTVKCTEINGHTDRHTDTMHELFSVLISFQCSWECPESDQPLLPTPGHRKTLSLCDHTKGAVSVHWSKYHGLTRD